MLEANSIGAKAAGGNKKATWNNNYRGTVYASGDNYGAHRDDEGFVGAESKLTLLYPHHALESTGIIAATTDNITRVMCRQVCVAVSTSCRFARSLTVCASIT